MSRLTLGVLALVALALVAGNEVGATAGTREQQSAQTTRVSEGSGLAGLSGASQSEVLGLEGSLGMGFAPMAMRPAGPSVEASAPHSRSSVEGTSSPTLDSATPKVFAFGPLTPNPFEQGTLLSFDLPTRSRVRIEAFDVRGRHVKTVQSEELGPGRYQRRWDGVDDAGQILSPGVYLIRIEASAVDGSLSKDAVRKALLLR